MPIFRLGLGLLALCVACLPKQRAPEPQPQIRVYDPVPAVTPPPLASDVAGFIYRKDNMIRNCKRYSGIFPRDIVLVWFHAGTPRDQRQAAVDSVSGKVIGGSYWNEDGAYIIQLPNAGRTDDVLREAEQILSRLPQVRMASPDFRQTGVSEIK